MGDEEFDQRGSIRDIPPSEHGGRVNRDGMNYQDHIGAGFCIDMIESEEIKEIWFEWHDDIVLFRNKNNHVVCELVQVKHEDLSSRYSIAKITERPNGKGSSLVEKSLNRSKGAEDKIFRILTSYDVTSNLHILKKCRYAQYRQDNVEEVNEVYSEIEQRLGDIESAPDGTTLQEWVRKCLWDKRPKNIKDIRLRNQKRLYDVLKNRTSIMYDQASEIYSKLVALVKECSVDESDRDYAVTNSDIERWISEKITDMRAPREGSETLKGKLEDADLSEIYNEALVHRQKYMEGKLSSKFSTTADYGDSTSKVTALLNRLRSKMDLGKINEGRKFHARCVSELHDLFDEYEVVRETFDEDELQGCMYDSTNRCAHRFVRADP